MLSAVGVLTGHTPAELAGIVANFRPDEVAVVDHHHGRAVGWVMAIHAERTNLWFVAAIEDAGAAARLRDGAVSVSLEMSGRGVQVRHDERGIVMPVILPSSYRGVLGPGWTLQCIALLPDNDRPAAPGSCIWARQ